MVEVVWGSGLGVVEVVWQSGGRSGGVRVLPGLKVFEAVQESALEEGTPITIMLSHPQILYYGRRTFAVMR